MPCLPRLRPTLALASSLLLCSPLAATLLFTNEGTKTGWDAKYGDSYAYSINEVSSPTRSGATAVKHETRYGNPDPGGRYHASLIERDMGKRGTTRWYGASTYLATNTAQHVVQQWFNKRSNCPVMMFSAGTNSPEWRVKILYGPDKPNNTEVVYDLTPWALNTWTDIVMMTKFRSDSTGQCKVWINGTLHLDYNGPTCLANDNQLYFHSELYAFYPGGTANGTVAKVYNDSTRIGDGTSNFDEVKPR